MADALKVKSTPCAYVPAYHGHAYQGLFAMQAQGNKAFQAGQFEEAIKHFTDAINLDPSNHVLYSNRSASHVSELAFVQQIPTNLASSRVNFAACYFYCLPGHSM